MTNIRSLLLVNQIETKYFFYDILMVVHILEIMIFPSYSSIRTGTRMGQYEI
jgi:hypothetical protein